MQFMKFSIFVYVLQINILDPSERQQSRKQESSVSLIKNFNFFCRTKEFSCEKIRTNFQPEYNLKY